MMSKVFGTVSVAGIVFLVLVCVVAVAGIVATILGYSHD